MSYYRDDRDRDYERLPRRSAPDVATEVLIRERERSRDRTPAFLRDPPRRGEAGPVVLRREVETTTRRRSPSPAAYREERVERIVRRGGSSPSPSRGGRGGGVSVERIRTRVRRDSSSSSSMSIASSVSPPPRRALRRPRSVSPDWKATEHVTIVKRQRSPSPKRPPPPPEPQVIRGPTIEREIITHYTDIDHGVVVARPPSPKHRPRGRSSHRDTEIDIYTSRNETEVDIHRHQHSHGRSKSRARSKSRHRHVEDQLVVVDRNHLTVDHRHHHHHHHLGHRRAHSAAPLPSHSRDDEADEIIDAIDSRGRMGEARGGATRDWTIIDVPPGTERVRMDGVGGGSAEVTWSRFSGVRRTKFIPERDGTIVVAGPPPRSSGDRLNVHVHDRDREIDIIKDRRLSPRPKPRSSEMWTEITKDLVSREAIRRLGYPYEETRWFYYIMEYLRHEEVQRLIALSADIRRARRLKSRQVLHDDVDVRIHRHKHRHERSPYRPFVHEGDQYVEREVVVDRNRYRY